jgi:hypothetical protein
VKFQSIACDNCKRVLCRDGEAHFPRGFQDYEQHRTAPHIIHGIVFASAQAANDHAKDYDWVFGLVFSDERLAFEMAEMQGWRRIGEKTYCPECSSPWAQTWLAERMGNRFAA